MPETLPPTRPRPLTRPPLPRKPISPTLSWPGRAMVSPVIVCPAPSRRPLKKDRSDPTGTKPPAPISKPLTAD